MKIIAYIMYEIAYFLINGFYLISYNLPTKAELLLPKLIHLFTREVLLVKKLEIEETKTT